MTYNSLRPIRERKGLTVAQLAGKTSISIRTLQAYEVGERTISPDDLRKLSRVLFVSPAEILQQPATPPEPLPAVPAPPPVPVPPPSPLAVPEPPVVNLPPVTEVAPSELPPRRVPVALTREAPRPGADGPGALRPRPPRLPREAKPLRPPGPSTAGQLEQIRNLARRMGLDDVAVAERIGSPLDALNHATARAAISDLRKHMEETGTWQPRVGEGPDQEGEYLAKLRDRHAVLDVQMIDGEHLRGTVADFTPYVIQLRDPESGAEVSVRKLAIAYYKTQGPVDDVE